MKSCARATGSTGIRRLAKEIVGLVVLRGGRKRLLILASELHKHGDCCTEDCNANNDPNDRANLGSELLNWFVVLFGWCRRRGCISDRIAGRCTGCYRQFDSEVEARFDGVSIGGDHAVNKLVCSRIEFFSGTTVTFLPLVVTSLASLVPSSVLKATTEVSAPASCCSTPEKFNSIFSGDLVIVEPATGFEETSSSCAEAALTLLKTATRAIRIAAESRAKSMRECCRAREFKIFLPNDHVPRCTIGVY